MVVTWKPGHNVTRPPSVFAGRAPQREASLLMAGSRVHPPVSTVLQFPLGYCRRSVSPVHTTVSPEHGTRSPTEEVSNKEG